MHGSDTGQRKADAPASAAARWLAFAVAVGVCAGMGGCSRSSAAPASGGGTALGSSHEGVQLSGANESGAVQRNDAQTAIESSRQAWQFAEHTGHLISTPNYRLFTTVNDDQFLQDLPRFCELALHHYTTAITPLPMPAAPLETFLFQTRTQWLDKTREMLPEQSSMFSNLGRGGYTTRGTSVLYFIDGMWRGYPRDTLAIAAHEGWHQYTQRTFKHQLPIWLEEGVATYMEGYRLNREPVNAPSFQPAWNFERHQALRQAWRDDDLIPLEQLLTRTPQSFLNQSKDLLLTYYAQVWALTRFLAEHDDGRYKAALAEVLQDAAHGRLVGRMMMSEAASGMRRRGASVPTAVGPAVVREYFNANLDEFQTQYLSFVEELSRQSLRYRR